MVLVTSPRLHTLCGCGQLGQGHTNNIGDDEDEMGDKLDVIDWGTDFVAVDIVCGYGHTCVLSSEGKMRCCGESANGQLGYENSFDIGDDSDEMGDALSDIDLGSTFTAVSIDCGYDFSCALSSNHGLFV